ncbi:MAG: hypothetical protein WCY72_13200, partial [Lysobacteraceae bacterium]
SVPVTPAERQPGYFMRGVDDREGFCAASAEKCTGHFIQSGNMDQMAIWCGCEALFCDLMKYPG